MKLTSFAGGSSLSTVLASVSLHTSIPSKPLSYAPISPNPKPPIFLRAPTFSAPLSAILHFQNWAKTLSQSVGSSFLDSDNGPDSNNLLRELNWLLEDALENPNSLSPSSASESATDTVLQLRVNLDDLYSLWKQRIEKRRPFQYIVGCEHWRDLVLRVEEGVLIPRPETELIVDLVSDLIERDGGFEEGLWVDLGTGSGAIAIGIGRILGGLGRVIATDLSPVAVQVASFNIKRYKLEDKISIKQGSWFEPLKEVEGRVAGLVSNPPYIPSQHITRLQAEVSRHEPILALDGGEDGLSDLLHLCNGAASMLKPGGFFAFETNGEDHCKFLVKHLESRHNGSFYNVNIIPDFAGIQRFVTGFRSS